MVGDDDDLLSPQEVGFISRILPDLRESSAWFVETTHFAMLPTQLPYPTGWWGTSLEVAGLGDARPRIGTYGCYDFEALPTLPYKLRGDFGWLEHAPRRESHIGLELSDDNAKALPALLAASARLGLRLPTPFVTFLETASLQSRIRSTTDCRLDLCAAPIPEGGGYLVRFLSDSQDCVFWYLYLARAGADHAVVASPEFLGTDAEQARTTEPDAIVYCAGSFEEFLCRFWLENELWFSAQARVPMSVEQQQYVDAYRLRSK